MYVMHLNSTCNQNKSKESIFVEQREEKEVPTKSYGRENGIFPPPPPPHPPCGFWHKRRNGEKMQTFSEQPSGQTFPNNGESYASAISWLETCISFEILTSLHICLRGSRTPFHKNADFLDDFSVNARNEDILKLTLVCFFRVVLVDSIFISWL